jgi:hypothetical protein
MSSGTLRLPNRPPLVSRTLERGPKPLRSGARSHGSRNQHTALECLRAVSPAPGKCGRLQRQAQRDGHAQAEQNRVRAEKAQARLA